MSVDRKFMCLKSINSKLQVAKISELGTMKINESKKLFNQLKNDIESKEILKRVKLVPDIHLKIEKALYAFQETDLINYITTGDDESELHSLFKFRAYIEMCEPRNLLTEFISWWHLPLFENKPIRFLLFDLENRKLNMEKQIKNNNFIAPNEYISSHKISDKSTWTEINPYSPFYLYYKILNENKKRLNDKKKEDLIANSLIYLMHMNRIKDLRDLKEAYSGLLSYLNTLFELLSLKNMMSFKYIENNVLSLENQISEYLKIQKDFITVDVQKEIDFIDQDNETAGGSNKIFSFSFITERKSIFEEEKDQLSVPDLGVQPKENTVIDIVQGGRTRLSDKILFEWLTHLNEIQETE